ncbi:MAG TPA: N-acetylglucosamine-6-phosphate deacetylase [Gammaproteobacteria bacterium]|nr:N-acetylglucosamine-6-phosphate deacetylase [Gammaproteobacteria bacterium]
MTILFGPRIYAEKGILKNTSLIIRDNQIHAFEAEKKNSSDEVFIFPDTYHIVPGFIDVHVHGANGFDVMDATPHALESISQALAMEGTTAWLATTMTASLDEIDRAMKNTGDYIAENKKITGAALLGIHLEGPFLSPEKSGAQNKKYLLPPRVDYFKNFQKKSRDTIKLVTLAPELPNACELIHFLKTQNIVASIGHTNATFTETMAAIDAGCSHVTHLFNAMRGMHQREPGVVTAGLLSDKLSTELIVDGIHLHPSIVDLVFRIKQPEKMILVTDAMRAKCLKDGLYDLGGQAVHVADKKATLPDGTLAGSVLDMISAMRNMMAFTNCHLQDVIRFVSENPARMLGIFNKKGSLLPGKDADLVVLDEALNVVLTMVSGKIVYQKQTETRGS